MNKLLKSIINALEYRWAKSSEQRYTNWLRGKGCRIGNNVVVRGGTNLEDIETETYSVVDGIIVLKKSVVIPAGSRIGDV